jgi:hypothetical protein
MHEEKYCFYAGEYSEPEGARENGEGGDRNDPAEKSYYITEGYVICFDSLYLPEFNNQDCPQGGNAHDNYRPADDQPFEKICQVSLPRSTCTVCPTHSENASL